MIWNVDTQPLPALLSSYDKQRVSPTPDTFTAYLQRHHLSILEAARLATLPSLLVWRASKWPPISEGNAWKLIAALGLATGETFRGLILTTRAGNRPKAIRFCV